MGYVFYIGPIRVTIEGASEHDRAKMSVCQKILYPVAYEITLSHSLLHPIPSSIEWFHKKTHVWGVTDDAYYLWCRRPFERVDNLSNPDSFWRCRIKKDISQCEITPPLDTVDSFLDTLIFSRLLAAFVANRPLLLCHCAVALINNVGVVFLGESDAGKTTISKIITDGRGQVLSDDRGLVFGSESGELFVTGVPRSVKKPAYFFGKVVPVRRVFLLDKFSEIGEYPLDPRRRYIALAESFFMTSSVVADPTVQILKSYTFFKDIRISRLGFDKSQQTWEFLSQEIS